MPGPCGGGGQAQSKGCFPAAPSRAPGSCPIASQPQEPHCFLRRTDAVPLCSHQQNCQPLSQSIFILRAPGAAEQLVGGIGAVIRGVFFQTDNPIPQKVYLLASSNPSLLKFLVLQFGHLLSPTRSQGRHRPSKRACSG